MRKLFAIVATLGLLAAAPSAAFAGHRDGHQVPPGAAKNAPAPPDCEIEVDFLGVCLG